MKKNNRQSSNPNITPVVVYENAGTFLQKKEILNENKGKAGVYRFLNKINGKSYIGSGIDLRIRFYVYYSIKRLNSSKMILYKALLKYGARFCAQICFAEHRHSNFSLEILEYCSPYNILEREEYYFNLLKPEYNILQKPRSSLGYKHLEEAKPKISEANKGKNHKGKNNPNFAARTKSF